MWAVAISGKIFGLLFSLTIWFTFPGRAVANMILLVYFSVNIFWFTFSGGVVGIEKIVWFTF